jgi:hypothetical protein
MLKKIIILSIFLWVLIGIPLIAFASDVEDAEYLTEIQVTNSSATAITNEVAVFTLSTESMITGLMLNATADDAVMRTGTGGTDLAFMPSANASYPWCTWVNSIGGNSSIYELLYTKGASDGKICYFPGTDGMEIADNETMELGDEFQWLITDCWVDTDASANKTIMYKDAACRLFVSDTVSGNVTFEITGGASVSALAIPTGEYDIEVSANVTDLRIYFDSVLRASTPFTANVTDNDNPWVFFSNDSVRYVRSLILNN